MVWQMVSAEGCKNKQDHNFALKEDRIKKCLYT